MATRSNDPISTAGLSPPIIDGLPNSVLKAELSEILEPAGCAAGSMRGFDNKI